MVLISHNSQTWRTYTQKFNTNQFKRYHQSTNHRSIKITHQNPSQNTNITTSTIPKPHNNCINEREFKSNIKSKSKKKKKLGEQSPTIAFALPSATNLGMGFPIGLYSVLLQTLITFPLLLTMFSTEMLLYPCEIAQSSWWVVVHKIALDTHTPSSSPPCSTSALASMEDCDLADEATDFDPSETLCCKFHAQIDSSPLGSSEIEPSLPHLDLPQPQASMILVWWARWMGVCFGSKECLIQQLGPSK